MAFVLAGTISRNSQSQTLQGGEIVPIARMQRFGFAPPVGFRKKLLQRKTVRMHFDATGTVMKTFFKSLLARVPGDGQRLLIFFVIVVIVGAVVADRAISKGMNVSLTVASFLTLTATTPASPYAEPQPPAVDP